MYITKKYKRKYHFKEISDGNGLIRKVIAITVRKESDLSEKKVKKVNCISDMYVFIYVLSEHGVAVVYFLLEKTKVFLTCCFVLENQVGSATSFNKFITCPSVVLIYTQSLFHIYYFFIY